MRVRFRGQGVEALDVNSDGPVPRPGDVVKLPGRLDHEVLAVRWVLVENAELVVEVDLGVYRRRRPGGRR